MTLKWRDAANLLNETLTGSSPLAPLHFEIGPNVMIDQIKLNDKGVRAYMSAGGAVYRHKAEWSKRTGKVAKYSRDRSHAYVMWDGTRSFDRVPVNLLEPASAGGPEGCRRDRQRR
jgi:hypothetical protein